MKTRVITALIIIAILAPILYLGGIPFKILAAVATILATREILALVGEKWNPILRCSVYVLALATVFSDFLGLSYFMLMEAVMITWLGFWLVHDVNVKLEDIGLVYIISTIFAMMIAGILRMYDYGNIFVFYMAFGTTFPDMFALFIGKAIGKHKLNERISPNKTIEGSVGGYIVGLIVNLLFGFILLKKAYGLPTPFLIVSALTLPVVGQIGDLFYSAIKRHYGIKDFSNLFPGHGGVLDRLDSISFNCMLLYALILVML